MTTEAARGNSHLARCDVLQQTSKTNESECICLQCLLRTLTDTWPCTSARVRIIRQCPNEDEVFIGKARDGESLTLAVRYRFGLACAV